MVLERLADAKAVATSRIDIYAGWHLIGIQFLIVVHTVDGQYDAVVVSQGDEGTWRMVADMLLITVLVHQLTLGLLAQQIIARALMGHPLLHRDDGIEQYLEVGQGVAGSVCGNGRGQMATCREAHDTYILRVDMPLLSMTAHQSDSLFSILGRHLPSTMRHAVFQHDEDNTLTIEERSPLVSFMVHSQMTIATARTAYHGTSCGLLLIRQIDPHLGHILRIAIAGLGTVRPQIHLYGLLCRSAYSHKQGGQQQ